MLKLEIAKLQDAVSELEKRISRIRTELQSQISETATTCDCSTQLTAINTDITSIKASVADFDTRIKRIEVAMSITGPTVEIE